jgi:exopolyphosphatase / guanosine-5'-triphosphate,3'-diphosphate pyrophosphatase
VRRACIDIGSNTTRLLVADCERGGLAEVHQERVFTRLARGVGTGADIPADKIVEISEVVSAQRRVARGLGVDEVCCVGTAAIRRATNSADLAGAIRETAGLELRILTGEEEARLAFLGAAGTLETPAPGPLGVVDVGGASSELIVGRAPDDVSWSHSFAVGSGDIAGEFLRSDPPSDAELALARDAVSEAMAGIEVPHPPAAVAVGGSAASLRRLAGELLDAANFRRTLELLASARAADIAARFALDQERVRLLPAGLVILEEASRLFRTTLRIGRGGIREGMLLEISA